MFKQSNFATTTVSEKILIILIFFYFITLNLFQASNQHWSSITDQDMIIVFNSLLIYSDIDQNYTHHPAFTTFLILGGLFKILSIFFDGFTLIEILNSNDIDQKLQNLFSIARILNSIFVFSFIFFIFKILKDLNLRPIITIFTTLLIFTFVNVYELLFLVRNEIVSVLFCLLGFNLLIRYVKHKKSKIYCFFSGLFFCLALLAKIQVIFLLFFLIILFPLLFDFFENPKSHFILNNFNFKTLTTLFSFILIGYFVFEVFFGFSILSNYVDKVISLPHYIDPILFLIFIIFYFLYLCFLSQNEKINLREVLSANYLILFGIIFCSIFFIFLDLIGLIKFHEINIFFLTNPIHSMSWHTWKIFDLDYTGEFNFKNLIVKFGPLLSMNYKLWINKIFTFEIAGILIGIQDFFRFIYVFICSLLLLFVLFIKKNKKITSMIFILFIGILVLIVSFGVRNSVGYNIYFYPLYLIIIALAINLIESKKFILLVFSIIFISSLTEFYLMRNFYEGMFTRENRIYHICGIDHWKNSENYVKKMNEKRFVGLVGKPKSFIHNYVDVMDAKFFKTYCAQLEKKVSWKTNFFNIKLK